MPSLTRVLGCSAPYSGNRTNRRPANLWPRRSGNCQGQRKKRQPFWPQAQKLARQCLTHLCHGKERSQDRSSMLRARPLIGLFEMSDPTFRFLRHRLVDCEVRLEEAERKIAKLEDVIERIAKRFCPTMSAEMIGRELFKSEEIENAN